MSFVVLSSYRTLSVMGRNIFCCLNSFNSFESVTASGISLVGGVVCAAAGGVARLARVFVRGNKKEMWIVVM